MTMVMSGIMFYLIFTVMSINALQFVLIGAPLELGERLFTPRTRKSGVSWTKLNILINSIPFKVGFLEPEEGGNTITDIIE